MNIENELLIASYVLNNKDYSKEIQSYYFQDQSLKDIIECVESVYKNQNIIITNTDSLIDFISIEAPRISKKIDIVKIKDIKTSYNDFSNIDYNISILKSDYSKNIVSKNLITSLISKTSSGGIIDSKDLLSDIEEIQKQLVKEDLNIFSTSEDLVEKYYKLLNDRCNPDKSKSIGFKVLDDRITRPGAEKEITIIAALRGVGKSGFKQTLENNLIHKNIPVVSFSLEMSETSTMDRYITMKTNVPMIQLNKNSKNIIEDEKVIRVLNELKQRKNYLFTDSSDLSFDKLDSALYKAKEIFRERGVLQKDDEYMVVTIDVLNMVSDFKDQEPRSILQAMDKLHNIVKKHKVHCIGVVQINETKLRGGKIYKEPQELDTYRPNLEDIYGGSGYAQRARLVLLLHRPKFLKERFFPDMQEIWDVEPDVLQVHCAKQNDGDLFLQNFIFDGERMRILPYVPDIEE